MPTALWGVSLVPAKVLGWLAGWVKEKDVASVHWHSDKLVREIVRLSNACQTDGKMKQVAFPSRPHRRHRTQS